MADIELELRLGDGVGQEGAERLERMLQILQGTLSHPLTTRDHIHSQTKIAATRFTGTAAWGQSSAKAVAIFVPEPL